MDNRAHGRAYPAGGIVPGAAVPQACELPGERRILQCAQDAKPAESGSPSGAPSHGQEPVACLIPLLQALSVQTSAMSRLAASNEGLSQAVLSMIEEMTKADAQEAEDEPRTYLDGSSVR